MEKPTSGKGDPGPPDEFPGGYRIPGADAELLSECDVDTFRAGGKGGQHQNKTETGVRLRHRPSGFRVESRRFRNQRRNRLAALEDLRSRLAAALAKPKKRKPSKVPLKERRRRVEEKRKRSQTKTLRKKPRPDDSC